jgi:hypothetical protein
MMPAGPMIIPTLLRENAPGGGVSAFAELLLDFPMDGLPAVEQDWAVHRRRLPSQAEHRHWNWDAKAEPSLRFVALMHDGRCEGLLAARKRLVTGPGLPRLYLSYIESAP